MEDASCSGSDGIEKTAFLFGESTIQKRRGYICVRKGLIETPSVVWRTSGVAENLPDRLDWRRAYA
jgi:hypothetical protein